MKRLIAALAVMALLGCTNVQNSTSLMALPDVQETGKLRVNPPIKEFALDSAWEVQRTCVSVNMGWKEPSTILAAIEWMLLNFRLACSKVPYDPEEPCIVIYKKGDEKHRQHERRSCLGVDDEWGWWEFN